MRAKLVTAVIVLLVCAAFVAWSTDRAFKILERLDEISVSVIGKVEGGEMERALELLGEMSIEWDAERAFMETVMPHEDLQRVIELITEAQANLLASDADDFSRSIALLRETVDHLRNHEKFSLENIL